MNRPPSRSAAQRALARLAADEVEHDVDVADALLDGLARVVDRLVGAELGQERVLGRARRPDHVRAARLGDLHRQVPDAAGGGEDQHALSGLDVGRLDERLPGRQPGERQRAGLDVAEPVRDPRELARGRGDVLGVGGRLAREARHPEDAVSGLEARHAAADLLDDAGDVPADRERRLAEEAAARPDLPVDRVDAGRAHADEHLGRARLGPRHLGELEHLGPAERRAGGCAHRRLAHRGSYGERRLLYTGVSPDGGEHMAAPTQTSSAFPSPYEIATPPGCEGWEEMYPYYALFDESRRETDEGRFWFWNSMHFPVPMPAFDVACIDAPVPGGRRVAEPVLRGAAGDGHRLPHRQRLRLHLRQPGHGPREDRRARGVLPAPRGLLLRALGRAVRQVEGRRWRR